MYDLIILGAGTAGLTASIYAIRGGLSVLIVENKIHGGQIINSPSIDNYPSLANVSGFDFINNLYNQCIELGANIVYESVTDIDFKDNTKIVKTTKNSYKAKTVIIATGAIHKKLGCFNEDKFEGHGVSYCATCDGAFYKDQDVAVIGGGNSAIDEALFLSKTSNCVYLIHRREEFRADKIMLEKVKNNSKIIILTNYIVDKVNGENKLSSITIQSTLDNTKKDLDVKAMFVAIGTTPQSTIFKDIIELDKDGYVIADENCKTNLKGIFVAGDIRTKRLRQLVTATSDGAVAATNAIEFLL